MLARFLDLPALVLDLLEQSHVLDGDARLVGEGGSKLDLFFAERSHGEAHQYDDADGIAFTQQRDTQDGAKPDSSLYVLQRVVGVGQHVGNLHRSAPEHRAAENAPLPGGKRNAAENKLARVDPTNRRTEGRDGLIIGAPLAVDRCDIGFA